MGAGGNMSDTTIKTEIKRNRLERVPISKPPFTLADIKKAIPPHCFQRSLIRSFSYLARDLILVSVFYYIANTHFHLLPSPYCYLAWPTYWFLQGSICTGVWLVAHECGHHSFSDYEWLDDTVGFILHSALLVPYFSWKISHRHHHSNTNSIELDENYVPRPKSELQWYVKYSNSIPLGRIILLLVLITFGWPLYMIANFLGRPYEGFPSHFDPHGPIFNHRERLWVYVSDAGVIAASYVLYRLALAHGIAWLVCIYVMPFVVMNSSLIVMTFLNHTHPSLPHYDSSNWDWLRGSLATVDRDYGVLNDVYHDSPHAHFMHHLFTTMPHYYMVEATKAAKPLLGEYYQYDDTPIFKALWREWKECIYVEKEGCQDNGVYWFKNKL
ncbi:unnamed protein product [Withania somnifera]